VSVSVSLSVSVSESLFLFLSLSCIVLSCRVVSCRAVSCRVLSCLCLSPRSCHDNFKGRGFCAGADLGGLNDRATGLVVFAVIFICIFVFIFVFPSTIAHATGNASEEKGSACVFVCKCFCASVWLCICRLCVCL
jgi:hypothetical protein